MRDEGEPDRNTVKVAETTVTAGQSGHWIPTKCCLPAQLPVLQRWTRPSMYVIKTDVRSVDPLIATVELSVSTSGLLPNREFYL